jgi:hypothetical protein
LNLINRGDKKPINEQIKKKQSVNEEGMMIHRYKSLPPPSSHCSPPTPCGEGVVATLLRFFSLLLSLCFARESKKEKRA